MALKTSHKRQNLTGYCRGPPKEKTHMGVASAHPAKNQRHAFEDCLTSAVAFAFARRGDIIDTEVLLNRCSTISTDMMGKKGQRS